MPTHADISSSPLRAELESEWASMLGHQLPVLPPFEQFWEEAEVLFQWLEGDAVEEPVQSIGAMTSEDQTWSPPPTLETWGRASLEVVRFAGVNHLLVELGYGGSTRLIEPYSLRRSSAGNLLLYGVRADSREIRCYRVDRIQSARATTQPFQPVFAIESAAGDRRPPLHRAGRIREVGHGDAALLSLGSTPRVALAVKPPPARLLPARVRVSTELEPCWSRKTKSSSRGVSSAVLRS